MTRGAAISQYHKCAKRNNCPGEYRRIMGSKTAAFQAVRRKNMMKRGLKAIRKNRKQKATKTRSSARLRAKKK